MKSLLDTHGLQLVEVLYENEYTGRALFKVRRNETGLFYTLKRLSQKENAEKTALREVVALNRLPFGLAPHCHQILHDPGHVFLLLDWIEGAPMSRYFSGPPEDRYDLDRRLHALQLAALRLDTVHRARLLHRDIKPDNIIINGRADSITSCYLIDFGLAAQARNQEEGTIAYRAPEQDLRRDRNITAATDIFSLGQTGWFLLNGEPADKNYNDDYSGWASGMPPLLPAFCGTRLADVMDKATCFEPGQRYLSASQFANDINNARKQLQGGRSR